MLNKVCGDCATKHKITASGKASFDNCAKCRKYTAVKTVDVFNVADFMNGMGVNL